MFQGVKLSTSFWLENVCCLLNYVQFLFIFLVLEVWAQQYFYRRRMIQTEIFRRTSKKNGVLEVKSENLTGPLMLLEVSGRSGPNVLSAFILESPVLKDL